MANGKPDRFLKIASGRSIETLDAEADRLRWLKGRLSAPELLAYIEDQDTRFLLMTAIPGAMACDSTLRGEEDKVVRHLAKGLRQIHSLPIAECPFDQTRVNLIAQAKAEALAGTVDESDFEPEWQGRTAADLFQDLVASTPSTEERVFTHGDYCLPNILIHDGNVSGFVDLHRAGISDPYRDLALALRSITSNLGSEWRQPFLDAYGLPQPDDERLRFYTLLDEFF